MLSDEQKAHIFTDSDLSILFGVSTNTIASWRTKGKLPNKPTLEILCKCFHDLMKAERVSPTTTKAISEKDKIRIELDKVKLAKETRVLVPAAEIDEKLRTVANNFVDNTKKLHESIMQVVSRSADRAVIDIISKQVEQRLQDYTKETGDLFK